MRRLVPVRGSVVCTRVQDGARTTCVGGVRTKVGQVDLFRIQSLPEIPAEDCMFSVGDVVMSNSTGDEIEINPGETVYLFKLENLMCRVCDDEEGQRV